MTTTLQTRIAEVLALADKATLGPWNLYFNSQDNFIVRKMFAGGGEAHVIASVHRGAPNARFIAAAPEMADLLRQCDAEIERLEKKRRALRNRLISEMQSNIDGPYELRVASAEAKVNEFEEHFEKAMGWK